MTIVPTINMSIQLSRKGKSRARVNAKQEDLKAVHERLQEEVEIEQAEYDEALNDLWEPFFDPEEEYRLEMEEAERYDREAWHDYCDDLRWISITAKGA